MERLGRLPEAMRNRVRIREPKVRPQDEARLADIARLRALTDRVTELHTRVRFLEDEALQGLYAEAGEETFSAEEMRAALTPLQQTWEEVLLTFYCRDFPNPDRITLVLFSEEKDWLFELTQAYLGIAAERQFRVDVMAYRVPARPASGRCRTRRGPGRGAAPSLLA